MLVHEGDEELVLLIHTAQYLWDTERSQISQFWAALTQTEHGSKKVYVILAASHSPGILGNEWPGDEWHQG